MNRAVMTVIWCIVVLETTIIPLPLTITMVSVISMVWGFERILFLFFLGLFYDVFTLQLLGSSSAFFLIVCVVARRYQRKLYVGRVMYALIFISVITGVYEWIFSPAMNIYDIAWSAGIGGIMLLFVNRFL